jgi:hypothetical protein
MQPACDIGGVADVERVVAAAKNVNPWHGDDDAIVVPR